MLRDNALFASFRVEFDQVLQAVGVRSRATGTREDADTVLDWLFECCVDRRGAELQSSIADRSYADFCKRQGTIHLGQQAFNTNLHGLGHLKKKGRKFNSLMGLALLQKNPSQRAGRGLNATRPTL